MDGMLPLLKNKIASYRVPKDLKLIWDQARLGTAHGSTAWFFDQRLQAGLRDSIALHTINGGTRKRTYGQWELAVHHAGCAHFAYNFVGHKNEEDRLRSAYIALQHDYIEDAVFKAKKLGLKFGLDAARNSLNAVTGIWNNPADKSLIRRYMRYLTDRKELSGEARTQDQENRSFDPHTGQCIISIDEQIARFADKYNQLENDLRARRLGLLPDEKLERQIKKAERKSWVCKLPVIMAHPHYIDAYNSKLAALKSELKIIKNLKTSDSSVHHAVALNCVRPENVIPFSAVAQAHTL